MKTDPTPIIVSASGQMTMEMILIIVCLLSVALTFSKTVRSQNWMNSIVSGPWIPLKSMIEDGVWITSESKSHHPHHINRHGSYEADAVTGSSSDGEIE